MSGTNMFIHFQKTYNFHSGNDGAASQRALALNGGKPEN